MSDRRLKVNIRDLERTLQHRGDVAGLAREGPLWILRQLRPVSYNFRQGNHENTTRFGFIADELQKMVPEVVRSVPGSMVDSDGGDVLSVAYQDVIALLAMASKKQLQAVEHQQVVIEEQRRGIAHEQRASANLAMKIENMEQQITDISTKFARVWAKRSGGDQRASVASISELKGEEIFAGSSGSLSKLEEIPDVARGIICLGYRILGEQCPIRRESAEKL